MWSPEPEPMAPVPFRVTKRTQETYDTFTLELVPDGGAPLSFLPGQFNMLYAFGVGEVPISVSGDPARPATLVHTVRDVGAVTASLGRLRRGDGVALRGPFGTAWPSPPDGSDVLIAAGGLGLAPLRPAIYRALAEKKRLGEITILYGARTPEDLLFAGETKRWAKEGARVHVAVGQATRAWRGTVGHVTALLPRAVFRPERTVAMLCGPEIMMRFTAAELEKRGMCKADIHVSLERNMKCAVGLCGHCQLGTRFVCTNGPVFPYDVAEPLMRVREL